MLVGSERAAERVLAQNIPGAAVLQIAAQHTPIVVDIDIFKRCTVQFPAAQLLKGAGRAPVGKQPRHGPGPARLVHKDSLDHARRVQTPRQRGGVGHGGGEHHRVGPIFAGAAPGPQQVYQNLIRRVADVQIRFHALLLHELDGREVDAAPAGRPLGHRQVAVRHLKGELGHRLVQADRVGQCAVKNVEIEEILSLAQ